MNFAEIYPFIVALLIGALIGTERQRRFAEEKVRGVAGLRTFTLIALMGALSATLANHYGSGFAIAAFASLTILVGIGYAASVSTLAAASRPLVFLAFGWVACCLLVVAFLLLVFVLFFDLDMCISSWLGPAIRPPARAASGRAVVYIRCGRMMSPRSKRL